MYDIAITKINTTPGKYTNKNGVIYLFIHSFIYYITPSYTQHNRYKIKIKIEKQTYTMNTHYKHCLLYTSDAADE